jgi:uncharacterized protein (TIGR03086 family)
LPFREAGTTVDAIALVERVAVAEKECRSPPSPAGSSVPAPAPSSPLPANDHPVVVAARCRRSLAPIPSPVHTEATARRTEMTEDARGFHRRATDWFGSNVERVRDDQWSDATPCTDWNVRDLVHHLVSEQRWLPPLLAGGTIADVGDSLSGDPLGDDPKGSWRSATDEALSAVGATPGDRIVHLSYGDVTADHYVNEVATDLLIHGWDLARAIGADETMDAELVELVYQGVKDHVAELKASGLFGPSVTPPAGADRQTELLAIFGRVA